MKMQQPTETDAQQEVRARQRLRIGPMIKAALLAGLLVFVVPSGGPWMSHESFTSVMGRIASSNWLIDIVGHFVVALIYGCIVAACIYRPPTAAGIILGVALALPLYGLNYVLFGMAAGKPGNELHVGLTHFMFCLFFAVAYRAMAVPPPRGVSSPQRSPAEQA
jgi:hypothetical protein